jgi:hypothetical protein
MLKLKRSLSLLSAASVAIIAAGLMGGCSGSSGDGPFPAVNSELNAAVQPVPGEATQESGWAIALPQDYQQPWEELDASGYVIPEATTERFASALNANSEFRTGVDRFSETGDVSNLDQASVSAADWSAVK